MRVLLVNPPYVSLTSAHGIGHQIPFGLLCIGGPLIDAGHDVRLLDAERQRLAGAALAGAIEAFEPDVVMTGHAGPTPAHSACLAALGAVRASCPDAFTVYGGVYPTYHAIDIETTDPDTLAAIRKGSSVREDQQAVTLLRQRGILSMLGHIVGFEEERFRVYRHAIRQVAAYDPDLLNAMYVTPHRWSDWAAENGDRLVIQEDRSRWDYLRQLLSSRYLSPWRKLRGIA